MSRDALPYVADIVAAREAIRRFTGGVTFEAFAANREKRAAVEREVFIVGEAAARGPHADASRYHQSRNSLSYQLFAWCCRVRWTISSSLLYTTQISVRLVLLTWAGAKEASLTCAVT